jgi:CubicO group peptidase (beta-lactamase class C family)
MPKIYLAKLKYIEYKNKKCYAINTIDKENINYKSQFLIVSVTKIFTALLVLILHKNNLLNINDKVDDYINLHLNKITILDILQHRSGLILGP